MTGSDEARSLDAGGGTSVRADFSGLIERKLTLFFALLVFLVGVIGGVSLILARSIFIATQEIKKESERIDAVDRMHYTVHHLIERLDAAILRVDVLTEAGRGAYLDEISELLRRYGGDGGDAAQDTAEFWRALRDLDYGSRRIVKELGESPRVSPGTAELRALAAISGKIQSVAHGWSAVHRARMEQLVRESGWKMQGIFWAYAVFAFFGACLILGARLFFSRAVARPLRLLAQAAGEIAQGNLNKKIEVRTKDEIGRLGHAFNAMAERLKEKERKLQGLAALEERERISRELHDTLAQDIVLLRMKLNEAEMDLPLDDCTPMARTLDDIGKIAERAYEDLRQSIFGLRTMVSKGLGFIPSVTEYLHDFSAMSKIPVALKIDKPEAVRFPVDVEVQLIRIIHEALTNVFKHAEARNGKVHFKPDGEHITVTIEDDGRGFCSAAMEAKTVHFGLKTMRERAEAVGGKLVIDSAPGKGTTLAITLPLRKEDGDGADSGPAGR